MCVGVGQLNHRVNVYVERNVLKAKLNANYMRPLSREKAFDEGVEWFGEAFSFAFMLAWGVYEINKNHRDGMKKTEKSEETFRSIYERIEGVRNGQKEILGRMEALSEQI